jgi:fatty acid desaturase
MATPSQADTARCANLSPTVLQGIITGTGRTARALRQPIGFLNEMFRVDAVHASIGSARTANPQRFQAPSRSPGACRRAAVEIFALFQRGELYHHQFTQTVNDPDRAIYARYPLGSRKFFRLLLRDVCGMNVLTTLKYFIDLPLVTPEFNRRFLGDSRAVQYQRIADMRAFAVFWLVVLTWGQIFGGSRFIFLFGLYWLVPHCTLTQVFFRIRGAIEHGNVPDPQNPYRQTRTYFLHPAVAFFFAPKGVNYHLEHYLYPSVPFFHLPRLHAELRRTVYPLEAAYYEEFFASLRRLVRRDG